MSSSSLIHRVTRARVWSTAQTPSTTRYTSSRALATKAAKAPAQAPAAKSPASPGTPTLSWPDYLAIRGAKHRYELAALVPSALTTFGITSGYFMSRPDLLDPSVPLFGMDPTIVIAGVTVAATGIGALFGPPLGALAWRTKYRSILPQIESREREFYSHILKNRVDPAAGGSANNPVPDFYGEKIGSLSQYRQWLRDQNTFRRKARWAEE